MTLSYCLDRASGPGVLRGFTVFKTVHIDELGLVQSFRELTVECGVRVAENIERRGVNGVLPPEGLIAGVRFWGRGQLAVLIPTSKGLGDRCNSAIFPYFEVSRQHILQRFLRKAAVEVPQSGSKGAALTHLGQKLHEQGGYHL